MPAMPSVHETPPRKRRVWLWTCIVLLALVAIGLGYYRFVLDWTARPYCHKQVQGSLMIWMNDRHTDAFPNVLGRSRASLLTFDQELGGDILRRLKDYNYVAGLKEGDPGDLVLMCVNQPTRWKWHGLPQTKFKPQGWVTVPVDFKFGRREHEGDGELSEFLTAEQFRDRLKKTLEFLRANDRLYWPTVMAEHSNVLYSLEHPKE